jgi:hypothetical protein
MGEMGAVSSMAEPSTFPALNDDQSAQIISNTLPPRL